MAQQTEWYYAAGSNQVGPISLAELQGLTSAGTVKPTDLVWREGMADWTAASAVPDLSPVSQPRVAPIAASPVGSPVSPVPVQAMPYQAPRVAPGSPASVLPYGGGGANPYESPVSRRSIELLGQTRPWVLFFAVLLFIGAGFAVLGGLFGLLGGVAGGLSGGSGSGVVGVMGLLFGLFYIAFALLAFMPGLYLTRYASRISKLRASGRSDDLEGALEAQKSYWKFIGIAAIVVISLYLIGFILLIAAFSMK